MKKFIFKSFALFILMSLTYYHIGPMIVLDDALHDQTYKWRKMRKGDNFDIIIMGDSRALAMKSKGYGRDGVFNYAMSYFGGALPYRYILKRYLKFNTPPKAILFSIVPETLCEEEDYKLGPRAAGVLPPLVMAKGRSGKFDFGLFFQALKLKYVFNNVQGQLVESEKYDKSNGSLIFNRFQIHSFNPKQNYFGEFVPDGIYRPTTASLKNLGDFFQNANKHNIQIYFYMMPIPELVYKKHLEFYGPFTRHMRKWIKTYPWVHLIRPYGKEDLYPASYFSDGTHLNQRGAEHYNRVRFPQLIRLIRKEIRLNGNPR